MFSKNVILSLTMISIDPDMLEVGNGGMNLEEYRSHFSIWAAMKVCSHISKSQPWHTSYSSLLLALIDSKILL